MICDICPRKCKIDRNERAGFCGCMDKVIVSKVMLHHWEEPIISGDESSAGSGSIFFSGCNLKCAFCQNYDISHEIRGEEKSVMELASIMRDLEQQGAENINFVTPTHYTREIIEALKIYRPHVPIVWNTGGYESLETIQRLEGYVDIFLVDMKYADNTLAMKYSKAPDYVERNRECILEMRKIVPKDIIENGMMKKGIIIRHLVLPSHTNDSVACLKWIASNLGTDTIVSIMSQYEPMYDAKNFPEINRKITPLEYKRVVNFALSKNMSNSYMQDLSSANTCYTPKF